MSTHAATQSAATTIAAGDKVYTPSLFMPRPHASHDMTVLEVRDNGIVITNVGEFLARELKVRR